MLSLAEISTKEINGMYRPIWQEIKEYQLVLEILNKEYSFVKQNYTFTEFDELIKRLTNKLFLILRTAKPDTQNHFLENLMSFLKSKETQQPLSDPLFIHDLRKSITENFLENFYQSTVSLGQIFALFDDSIVEQIQDLLPTSQQTWFDNAKKTISDFKKCDIALESKKSYYTPSFFLKGDENENKQAAIQELKQRLEHLKLNASKNEVDKVFADWEKDFGPTIDKARYQPFLTELMDIFHRIQTLFSGKVFKTQTRYLIDQFKANYEITRGTVGEISSPSRSL